MEKHPPSIPITPWIWYEDGDYFKLLVLAFIASSLIIVIFAPAIFASDFMDWLNAPQSHQAASTGDTTRIHEADAKTSYPSSKVDSTEQGLSSPPTATTTPSLQMEGDQTFRVEATQHLVFQNKQQPKDIAEAIEELEVIQEDNMLWSTAIEDLVANLEAKLAAMDGNSMAHPVDTLSESTIDRNEERVFSLPKQLVFGSNTQPADPVQQPNENAHPITQPPPALGRSTPRFPPRKSLYPGALPHTSLHTDPALLMEEFWTDLLTLKEIYNRRSKLRERIDQLDMSSNTSSKDMMQCLGKIRRDFEHNKNARNYVRRSIDEMLDTLEVDIEQRCRHVGLRTDLPVFPAPPMFWPHQLGEVLRGEGTLAMLQDLQAGFDGIQSIYASRH